MITTLVFDCFGVLAQGTWDGFLDSLPDTTDWNALQKIGYEHDAGRLDDDLFRKKVAEITGLYPPRLEDMRSNEYQLNVQLLDYIKKRTQTYTFAILSNISNDWITEQLLDSSAQKLFKAVIASHEVGAAKPSHAIYHAALARLRVSPEEVVFVDDNQENVLAARACGMHGIHYVNMEQLKQDLLVLGVD